MGKYCVAVDIGASSGRVIAGCLEDGQLKVNEIHRFENETVKKGNYTCWDVEELFAEIKYGLKKCNEMDIQPISMGIDTWAVDFVILDDEDRLLSDAVTYRDPRTDGMMEQVFSSLPKEKIYLKTGIQFQKFNTLYQLYSLKRKHSEILKKAKSFLMIPDYINFLLTGKKVNEYTNSTTTQLVNAFTKDWDEELIDSLGLDREMFKEIKMPKSILGTLTPNLVSEIGYDLKVILPATHDTGSAVLSVLDGNSIYISSGTWSLIGVESDTPICTRKALDFNFTNEGGMDGRFRFLKNIMGLWMIQEVKRNLNDKYSFKEFVELGKQAEGYKSIVNVNDSRFLKPENMIEEIVNYCIEHKQVIPKKPGEIAKCIFNSLAESYKTAVNEIQEILEREFESINVIGGGCQNEMLNQLIADATGKEVYAGPVEATAIGNIIAQLIALGEIHDRQEARAIIKESFEVKKYVPARKKGEAKNGSKRKL